LLTVKKCGFVGPLATRFPVCQPFDAARGMTPKETFWYSEHVVRLRRCFCRFLCLCRFCCHCNCNEL